MTVECVLEGSVFTASLGDQLTKVGLRELIELAAAGRLVDLPRCPAYCRVGVVEQIATLAALLDAYPEFAADEAVWRATAADDEPAVLQTPVAPGTKLATGELDDLGPALTGPRHFIKSPTTGGLEDWLYRLMAAHLRVSSKSHDGSRCRVFYVVPTDGTIGSEIEALRQQLRPLAEGARADGAAPRDHLPWTRPWKEKAGLHAIQPPAPWLEQSRAVRLRPRGDHWAAAVVSGYGASATKAVVPLAPYHPARTDNSGTRPMSGRWSYRRVHHALVGGEDTSGSGGKRTITATLAPARAVAESDAPMFRVEHISAEATGATLGHRSLLVPAEGDVLAADDAAEVSRTILAGVAELRGILRFAAAGADLVGERSGDRERIDALVASADADAGWASIAWLLELLQAEPARRDDILNRHLRAVAERHWRAFRVDRYVAHARGRVRLRQQLDRRFPVGDAMPRREPIPANARRCFARLKAMDQRLSDDDRSRLRAHSLTAKPPFLVLSMLAQVHADLTSPVWRTALHALGHLRADGRAVGRALADTDYPEPRLEALLGASGDALDGQVAEAIRWLVAHGVGAVRLSDLVALAVADRRGDAEAYTWARETIAFDYARAASSKASRDEKASDAA